jgi:hypothetical protein
MEKEVFQNPGGVTNKLIVWMAVMRKKIKTINN